MNGATLGAMSVNKKHDVYDAIALLHELIDCVQRGSHDDARVVAYRAQEVLNSVGPVDVHYSENHLGVRFTCTNCGGVKHTLKTSCTCDKCGARWQVYRRGGVIEALCIDLTHSLSNNPTNG